MNDSFGLKDAALEVLHTLTAAVAELVPRLLIAVVVILVGVLVARLAERAVRVIFDRFRINDLLERAGVITTLKKFGLQDSPGRLLSRTIYFLLIILFVQAVTRAVGLGAIADAISSFFAYLPNLVAAFLVLLLGMMVAQFIAGAVTRSAAEAGVEFAPILGRIVSSLILFVVVMMAISQLKIDTEIVRSVVLVLLSGFALAFALSFGLGSREVTRNIMAGFYVRKLFRVGELIEIGNERGTLVGITAMHALVEQDGETLSFPNRRFLDEVVRQ
jgi:small-conductance mechanosensitive channel